MKAGEQINIDWTDMRREGKSTAAAEKLLVWLFGRGTSSVCELAQVSREQPCVRVWGCLAEEWKEVPIVQCVQRKWCVNSSTKEKLSYYRALLGYLIVYFSFGVSLIFNMISQAWLV